MMNRKPKYDKEALKGNIERAKQNIQLFQDAIQKEHENIAALKQLIKEIEEENGGGQ